ncbi:hypothetical protein HPG69_018713 [Diceros bicornis minor]|uniref:Cytochrome P450 n=1 Tax=Diceros bicornis minor TaxID=77932 RepID=A0A7J7EDK1_DICBM|nr:hypothetical protein HPG69_018713 [Diceros bicornis minor]
MPSVVLNGLGAMREALVDRSEDNSNRPPGPIFEHLGFGPRSEDKRRRGGPQPGGDWAHSDRDPAGSSGGMVVDLRCREASANLKGRQAEEVVCAKGHGVDLTLGIEGRADEPVSKVCVQRREQGTHEPRPRLPAPMGGLCPLWTRVVGAAALLRVHPAQLRPGQEVTGAVGDRGGLVPLCRLLRPGRRQGWRLGKRRWRRPPDLHRPLPGRPFSPNALLNKAVSNVIASLTFGHRFEYNDLPFLKLLDLTEEGLKENLGFLSEVLNAIAMLLHIPGLAAKSFPGHRAFMTLLNELIAEHRVTWDQAHPPGDLTDSFLDKVEKDKGNPKSSFNDENLCLMVTDLFTAAMLTILTTLAWALLLMILYPDAMSTGDRRGDRADTVTKDGGPSHMPFTIAVVHEMQRFGDIIPLCLPHMTSRDIEVQGFLIPKGTTLITNLSSVLKDETIWKKPFCCHPKHFLDAQGHFVKQEAFMPFSAGRRSCFGEPLARMELFLFFTCLLQHFSFSVPTGQPRPSDHGVYGVLVTPSPYQLCAVPH